MSVIHDVEIGLVIGAGFSFAFKLVELLQRIAIAFERIARLGEDK